MRVLKVTLALVAVLAVGRYATIYYRSHEFDKYVRYETRHTDGKTQLKQMILERAGLHSLPVREEDINFTTQDSVFRVAVNYRVPVNLILFRHELAFQTVAARPDFGRRGR